jgi:hypothetical protein
VDVIFNKKRYSDFLNNELDLEKLYLTELTNEEIQLIKVLKFMNISAEKIKTLSRYKLWKELGKPYEYDHNGKKTSKSLKFEENHLLQKVLDYIMNNQNA